MSRKLCLVVAFLFLVVGKASAVQQLRWNWICATGEACVGGTQFNDEGDHGIVKLQFVKVGAIADGTYWITWKKEGVSQTAMRVDLVNGVVTLPVGGIATVWGPHGGGASQIPGGVILVDAGQSPVSSLQNSPSAGFATIAGDHFCCCTYHCSTEVLYTQTVVVNLGIPTTPTPTPTPPPSCSWSLSVNFRSRCPTGLVGPVSVELLVNGVTRSGPYVIPAGYTSGEANFDGFDPSGSSIDLKINGALAVNKQTMCFGDPPPPNWWHFDAIIGEACNVTPPPPPTPPAGSPTPGPLPSPVPFTPPPGGDPGPTAGPPTGSPTSIVGISNFNDFYEPVRKAVRDSGSDTLVTIPGRAALPEPEMDDSTMTGVADSLTELRDQTVTLADGVQSAFDVASSKPGQLSPAGIGSVGIISIPISGALAEYTDSDVFLIDFTKYDTGITILRAFLLWIMICTFFVLTVRALTYDN